MVRTFLLVAALAACLEFWPLHQTCEGQSLPSTRASLTGDGAVVELENHARLGDPHYGELPFDDDEETDSDDVLAYADIYSLAYHVDFGHAESTISGEAYINTASSGSSYAPEVDTSVIIMDDAEVEERNPEEDFWENFTEDDIYCNASAGFQIAANPSYPNAGSGVNSATLTATLWLVAAGETIGGGAGGGTGDMLLAEVGNSFVAANPLDALGENWDVQGTLQQSSSSDPDAEPLILDDTYVGGINEMWVATEATEVDAQFFLRGRVQMGAGVRATNDDPVQNPNGVASALHQWQYKASAWYQVAVP